MSVLAPAPFLRMVEAPFAMYLTAKDDSSGEWRYAFVERRFDPASGAYLSGDVVRSGAVDRNYATELSGSDVAVPRLVRGWLKASLAGQKVYEFVGPASPAGGYATTATSGGTTTLTAAGATVQYFTGTSTQDVLLPVVSTLPVGTPFTIVNRSTSAVSVESSGGNLIANVPAGSTALFTSISTSGTTASSWDYQFSGTTAAVSAAATASTVALRDASGDLVANNFLPGYSTTATAAGTTTLTAAGTYLQYFTGTTTQNVTLPVTSTLTTGWPYELSNLSTGAVTVQSSGGNTVCVIAPKTAVLLTCVSTSGTGASSWEATQVGVDLTSVTAGALLVGDATSKSYKPATLTAGSNVTITNADGSITIAAAGASTSPPSTVTLTSVPQWFLAKSIAFNDAALNVAATTADVTAWTMPAKAWIGGVVIHTQAAAVGVTTLSTQTSWNGSQIGQQGNGKTLDDVQGQAFWSTSGTVVLGIASWTATQAVKVHFSSSGANLSALSAGQWDVYVLAANLG